MAPKNDSRNLISTLIVFAVLILVVFVARAQFLESYEVCPIVEGPGVTGTGMLSDYFDKLKDTPGDTKVYYLEGDNPGGTLLIIGGLHPNEPAGMLAAVVAIENMEVQEGRVIIVPHANASAYTYTEPMQASPPFFTLELDWGERTFRYGSRLTSPLHQYPDPEAYTHPSGMLLSGSEVRNLNRVFPGRPDGLLTEQIAYGFMELIWQEDVSMVIDIHEARPINPVVNCIMAHPNIIDIASLTVMDLGADHGVPIRLEPSPERLRGITHREIGDASDALAVILESPNPAMDALRGPTNADLVVYGQDEFFKRASEAGLIRVPYVTPEAEGFPIDLRTGRHTATINVLVQNYNDFHFDKPIVFSGLPMYYDIAEHGLSPYLRQP